MSVESVSASEQWLQVVGGNVGGLAVLAIMVRYFMAKFDESQQKIVSIVESTTEAFRDELHQCQADKLRMHQLNSELQSHNHLLASDILSALSRIQKEREE